MDGYIVCCYHSIWTIYTRGCGNHQNFMNLDYNGSSPYGKVQNSISLVLQLSARGSKNGFLLQ